MDNKQLKEFKIYCQKQLNEEKNISCCEEQKEEEIMEEKEKIIDNNEDKIEEKNLKLKMSISKRLKSLPKEYETYPLDLKKQVVEEVIIKL